MTIKITKDKNNITLENIVIISDEHNHSRENITFNPFVPTVPTCAVRETASLGIMGAPRVPHLNPSESIGSESTIDSERFKPSSLGEQMLERSA